MLCALAFIMIFRGGHYNEQRLRRGPRYVRQDIQVTLAPSVSRRVIPFAATVLRSGTTHRYRSRVPFAQ